MIDFEPVEGVEYRFNYEEIFADIADGRVDATGAFRNLILNDLFFIVYFVMEIPNANNKFVVDACWLVENGPKTQTLDIWAREHFKSTIITIAETIQYHLRNPEHCTCIFSFKKPAAEKFLDSIRKVYEKPIMIQCFPDLLYEKPETESAGWSLQNGIRIKRKNKSRREATVEASGLVEGMGTGGHFDRRIYDDIETDDIAENPDQMNKCFSKFEVSDNLGTDGGTERVLGTYYSHAGPLIRIRDKVTINNRPMYKTRIMAATDNGETNGKPVLLSQERLDKLKVSSHFPAQQLCDPTPSGIRALDSTLLIDIEPEFIPRNVFKFMMVDPAGDDTDGKGDAWAIGVVGVEPKSDDVGASNIYILDLLLTPLRESEAPDEIAKMYVRNGLIQKVGIEKVGLSTVEIHVANALAKRGRLISQEQKTLEILRPAGRSKTKRIESALAWPLYNSKIHISTDIPKPYRDRLKEEMDKFPKWHDDGLDMLSYLYDMIDGYRFAVRGKRKNRPHLKVANSLTGY